MRKIKIITTINYNSLKSNIIFLSDLQVELDVKDLSVRGSLDRDLVLAASEGSVQQVDARNQEVAVKIESIAVARDRGPSIRAEQAVIAPGEKIN